MSRKNVTDLNHPPLLLPVLHPPPPLLLDHPVLKHQKPNVVRKEGQLPSRPDPTHSLRWLRSSVSWCQRRTEDASAGQNACHKCARFHWCSRRVFAWRLLERHDLTRACFFLDPFGRKSVRASGEGWDEEQPGRAVEQLERILTGLPRGKLNGMSRA